MITFPTTPEAFITCQEERAGCKFDDSMCELLGGYVELFNMGFDAGVKGLEPLNIIKVTVEFFTKRSELEKLERPIMRHIGKESLQIKSQ